MASWTGTIYGEVASLKNSRDLIIVGALWRMIGGKRTPVGGRPALIPSEKARAFKAAVERQVPVLPRLLEGRLRLVAKIYYTWEGPDLDESVILDCLQGRIFKNDRQVREKHVVHAIDKDAPRAVVMLEEVNEGLPLLVENQPTHPELLLVAR